MVHSQYGDFLGRDGMGDTGRTIVLHDLPSRSTMTYIVEGFEEDGRVTIKLNGVSVLEIFAKVEGCYCNDSWLDLRVEVV